MYMFYDLEVLYYLLAVKDGCVVMATTYKKALCFDPEMIEVLWGVPLENEYRSRELANQVHILNYCLHIKQ